MRRPAPHRYPTCRNTSSVVTGLFYGGGLTQFGLQALGSFSTVLATLAVSLVMMFALRKIGVLRVSKAGELEGLDIHEHGSSAYPEYALAGVADFSESLKGHADGLGAGEKETVSPSLKID